MYFASRLYLRLEGKSFLVSQTLRACHMGWRWVLGVGWIQWGPLGWVGASFSTWGAETGKHHPSFWVAVANKRNARWFIASLAGIFCVCFWQAWPGLGPLPQLCSEAGRWDTDWKKPEGGWGAVKRWPVAAGSAGGDGGPALIQAVREPTGRSDRGVSGACFAAASLCAASGEVSKPQSVIWTGWCGFLTLCAELSPGLGQLSWRMVSSRVAPARVSVKCWRRWGTEFWSIFLFWLK